MLALYKKELNYYLNNPIGYIIICLFGVFANFMFVKDIFVVGSASMRSFFAFVPWLFMIFIPAISMRSFAEERRANTIEVLLTLPISETQIVFAKFLALITVSSIALLLTLGLPVSLSFLSKLYFPEILVGYIGCIMLSGALISLSMFFSAQTKNQVVAFLASVVTTFLMLVVATDITGSVLPRVIQDFFSFVAPTLHFSNFIKGVIDLRSIVYFSGFITVFLFLTVATIEKRE